MDNLNEKSSLKEFSDREILELILANQVILLRRLTNIQDKVFSTKDGDAYPHFSDTFGSLYGDASAVKEGIDDYLQNR